MKPVRLLLALAFVAAATVATSAQAQVLPQVEVYKSPTCGCCSDWIEHLRKSGFKVVAHDVADVQVERSKLGMPDRLGSCHSAKVGDYVLEGHVPAADIRRLLKEKPKALGLTVPGMPGGSPGMESARAVPYDTLLVGRDGSTRVYASH